MTIYMRCNVCGKIVDEYYSDEYDEDLDQGLWGHIELEHPEEYEYCVDWGTPEMLEEYYTKESDV